MTRVGKEEDNCIRRCVLVILISKFNENNNREHLHVLNNRYPLHVRVHLYNLHKDRLSITQMIMNIWTCSQRHCKNLSITSLYLVLLVS